MSPVNSRWNARRSVGRASTNAVKLRVESLEDRLTPAYTAANVAYEVLDLVPGASGVTSILPNDDNTAVTINIGAHTFNFYGTVYSGTQMIVMPNGLITFLSAPPGSPSTARYANGRLDTNGPSQAAIAPLWDDLVTSVDLNDQVLYKIDASNRLIVEWNAVYNINGGSPMTFQAILQLDTGANPGAITFNYVSIDTGDISTANGASATVGIKNADSAPGGNAAITLSNNATTYAAGQAVQFTDIPPNLPPSIAISGAAATNEGSPYTLTLGTVTDPGHTVTSYTVNWGDGLSDTYGTAGAKAHVYADGVNFYDITVDLTDDRGPYTDNANALTVTVVDVAPTITISGAATAVEGSVYTLTLGATVDPGTDTITQYIVKWGDGTTDTYPTIGDVTHIYNSRVAPYAIIVDLVDEDGKHTNAANALAVSVPNSAPTATIASGPTTSNEGTAVSYTGTFTDPSGALDATFTYTWHVTASNGQVIPNALGNVTAYGTVPAFNFTPNDNGIYTVTLVVTDKDGGASSVTPAATRVLTVSNVAPTATLTNDGPQTGATPVHISFVGAADSSTVDASSLRYSYDFNGDGDFTDPGEIANSTSPTALYVTPTSGNGGVVHGRIRDKDGGFLDLYTRVRVPLSVAEVGPDVGVYYSDGTQKFAVRPFDGYVGSLTVASGDVTGDGIDDIVVGTQSTAAHVKVFDGATGAEIASFFAYEGFNGGVSVAVGDVFGKGYAQIITGAGPGGAPHVKVFDLGSGGLGLPTATMSFLAYDAAFTGGVTVAAGRLDSSGHDFLVTGAGVGGNSHVKVYDANYSVLTEVRSFLAAGSPLPGAVSLAADFGVIVIGSSAGGNGNVAIYSYAYDSVVANFAAYTRYNGDVRVALADHIGTPVIITGSGPGAAPNVRLFRLSDLSLFDSFFLGSVAFNGGVNVG